LQDIAMAVASVDYQDKPYQGTIERVWHCPNAEEMISIASSFGADIQHLKNFKDYGHVLTDALIANKGSLVKVLLALNHDKFFRFYAISTLCLDEVVLCSTKNRNDRFEALKLLSQHDLLSPVGLIMAIDKGSYELCALYFVGEHPHRFLFLRSRALQALMAAQSKLESFEGTSFVAECERVALENEHNERKKIYELFK
jgi:hypothetical protein